ncbi:hypothetical protein [Streptomyces sp. MS2.AVA.5]|uniref:Uncharacterized protein n=1 Tax=Streptomyces achmelvichensis TaxID=3134111 RepID=A0ACC6Q5G3_9ACTN
MSRRGRSAALPGTPHHRPVVREQGGLVVRHRGAKGSVADYDFALLPLAPPMQHAWAALFASRCAPGGGWDSLTSSRAMWKELRAFAGFLAAQDQPPEGIAGLTVAVWNTWRISRPRSVSGRNQVLRIAAFLRLDARLSEPVREAMAKRVPGVEKVETALAPDEFRQLRLAAQRMFRAAWLRIGENTELLHQRRAGAVEPGSRQWLVGEALDCLARTGDVPQYVGSGGGRRRVVSRYVFVLGGDNGAATWERLFLNRMEAVALAVLLVTDHGLNATTVSELPVPRATPDSGEGGFPVYRIELEKRRRGPGRHFETRNITDFGADSPGRLITKALEATAHARALVAEQAPDLDRLLLWRTNRPYQGKRDDELRVGVIGVSLHHTAPFVWGQLVGLSGSPMRRLRKTVNVLHRREPAQDTQDTHDSVYALSEPQAQQAAADVIADGIADALDHAHRTLRARLSDAAEPGDMETVTAACTDYHHSPFTGSGSGCRASFLLCTACPNARVTPAHHPRLAHIHQGIEGLRAVLDPAVWSADWGDAQARLEDLKNRLGPHVWREALSRVTAADREATEQLLNGHYDL